MINNEYIQSITATIFLVCLSLLAFYIVITFSTYFAGFFFGLLVYSFIDAYLKKDL